MSAEERARFIQIAAAPAGTWAVYGSTAYDEPPSGQLHLAAFPVAVWALDGDGDVYGLIPGEVGDGAALWNADHLGAWVGYFTADTAKRAIALAAVQDARYVTGKSRSMFDRVRTRIDELLDGGR